MALKAAALLHSLVRNHPLVDGNKRLAWLAAVVFLDINDYSTDLVDDEAFELVMEAAQGIVDIQKTADRLCAVPA
ncbi:type II toxin-antitoxin system death-on-curing family toxin [Frankia tisae]|uniref:type II toxin-antitoxin system death-on-curing family toxin n=1 Tax=Frankia tisae TaxID=2950104 RepID=UPI0034D744A4